MPTPAPTPAAKWLVDAFELGGEAEGKVEGEMEGEVEGEADGKVAGKTVGKGGIEDTKELEVVVVASVDAEKLEVVTATLEEEGGRLVEEVIAAREKIRDEVSQQFARERL
ncbi:hypothetical protein JMJ35_010370 [Cladonia borealis]|uniref:Uncharacterized protein n=1 Tax=Cladonia borealis TaxID=184061 RepID=A0AA39QQK0_9LECA|nr:hypothetical protein JMJ35_010370 [Cladonia borealis]